MDQDSRLAVADTYCKWPLCKRAPRVLPVHLKPDHTILCSSQHCLLSVDLQHHSTLINSPHSKEGRLTVHQLAKLSGSQTFMRQQVRPRNSCDLCAESEFESTSPKLSAVVHLDPALTVSFENPFSTLLPYESPHFPQPCTTYTDINYKLFIATWPIP